MTGGLSGCQISLVVSDVDGTIVDSRKEVLPSTLNAAGRLRQAGISLALVSSRPPRGMEAVYKKLGLNGPMAAFNGGLICVGDKVIAEFFVPEDAAKQTISLFKQRGISAWLFADDRWFLSDLEGKYVPQECNTVGFDPTIIEDFSPYLSRCGKIVGVSDDFELLGIIEAELNNFLGGMAVGRRSQDYYLDVTHPDANKGNALRIIADWYKIDLSDIAAIGDMTNDLAMFAVAGFSIAMGNAPPAVMAAAKAQTGSNTGSGWADAIEQYVLPNRGESHEHN